MNKVVINIIIGVLCLILGIIIGQSPLSPFTIDTKIGLLETADIVITVCFGIYLARILEKQIQDHRSEKDILIERITNIESCLSDIESIEADSEIRYAAVVSKISKAREKKNRLVKHLKKKLKGKNLKTIEDFETSLKPDFKTLKNLLTDSPLVPSTPPEVTITDGNVKYSASRIDEIITTIFDLNDKLLNFKLFINKL